MQSVVIGMEHEHLSESVELKVLCPRHGCHFFYITIDVCQLLRECLSHHNFLFFFRI